MAADGKHDEVFSLDLCVGAAVNLPNVMTMGVGQMDVYVEASTKSGVARSGVVKDGHTSPVLNWSTTFRATTSEKINFTIMHQGSFSDTFICKFPLGLAGLLHGQEEDRWVQAYEKQGFNAGEVHLRMKLKHGDGREIARSEVPAHLQHMLPKLPPPPPLPTAPRATVDPAIREQFLAAQARQRAKAAASERARREGVVNAARHGHEASLWGFGADFTDGLGTWDERVERVESLREATRAQGGKYTDEDYPSSDSLEQLTAVYGVDMEWVRVEDICPSPTLIADGFAREDIMAGPCARDWIQSALSALVSAPNGSVDRLLVTGEANAEGVYDVRFWDGSRWGGETVDDKFLCVKGKYWDEDMNEVKDGEWCDERGVRIPGRFAQPAFSHSKDRNEFWSLVVEKAWAKYHGGFVNDMDGYASEAICAFIPFSTSTSYYLLSMSDKYSTPAAKDELWATLEEAFNEDWVVTAVAGTEGGLHGGNFILKQVFEEPREGEPEGMLRLVKLSTPYPMEEANKGKWSDHDHQSWTRDMKRKLNYNPLDTDDGVCWMLYADFLSKLKWMDVVRSAHVAPGSANLKHGQWRMSDFRHFKYTQEALNDYHADSISDYVNRPEIPKVCVTPVEDCTVIINIKQVEGKHERDFAGRMYPKIVHCARDEDGNFSSASVYPEGIAGRDSMLSFAYHCKGGETSYFTGILFQNAGFVIPQDKGVFYLSALVHGEFSMSVLFNGEDEDLPIFGASFETTAEYEADTSPPEEPPMVVNDVDLAPVREGVLEAIANWRAPSNEQAFACLIYKVSDGAFTLQTNETGGVHVLVHGLQSLRDYLEGGPEDEPEVVYAAILATVHPDSDGESQAPAMLKPFTVVFIPDEVPAESIDAELQSAFTAVVAHAYATSELPECAYPYCAGSFVFYDSVSNIDTEIVTDSVVSACGVSSSEQVSLTRDPVDYDTVNMDCLAALVQEDKSVTDPTFKWRALTLNGSTLELFTSADGVQASGEGTASLFQHFKGECEYQTREPCVVQYIMATVNVPGVDAEGGTSTFWLPMLWNPTTHFAAKFPDWADGGFADCITERVVEAMYAAGLDANELFTHFAYEFSVDSAEEMEGLVRATLSVALQASSAPVSQTPAAILDTIVAGCKL